MASTKECRGFVSRIAPLIQSEAKSRGYLVCSAAIAQACVESAYGLSGLAKYHNYFGMKCGSKWQGKSVNMSTREEYTPGTLTSIRDNFRAYGSMEEGVRGYYDFISSGRYSPLKKASTPREYLERIRAAGYATSSTYVSTCMDAVCKWDLGKWDEPLGRAAGINPFPVPSVNLRLQSRGMEVKWLQYELNARGFPVDIDGIFGPETEGAVRKYQGMAGIGIDGVVGEVTRGKLLAGA